MCGCSNNGLNVGNANSKARLIQKINHIKKLWESSKSIQKPLIVKKINKK